MSSRVGRSYVLSPRTRRSTSTAVLTTKADLAPSILPMEYGGERTVKGEERRRPLGLPTAGRKDSPVQPRQG
jgi:hypothetical protein